jgi:hypothetical protein
MCVLKVEDGGEKGFELLCRPGRQIDDLVLWSGGTVPSRKPQERRRTYPLVCYVCGPGIAADTEGLCCSLELPGYREVKRHS